MLEAAGRVVSRRVLVRRARVVRVLAKVPRVLVWHAHVVRVLAKVPRVLVWHARVVRVLAKVPRVLVWHARVVRVLAKVPRVLVWLVVVPVRIVVSRQMLMCWRMIMPWGRVRLCRTRDRNSWQCDEKWKQNPSGGKMLCGSQHETRRPLGEGCPQGNLEFRSEENQHVHPQSGCKSQCEREHAFEHPLARNGGLVHQSDCPAAHHRHRVRLPSKRILVL
jgi:hypothetical protein